MKILFTAAIVGYPACKRNLEAARDVKVGDTRLLKPALSAGRPLVCACIGNVYGAVSSVR